MGRKDVTIAKQPSTAAERRDAAELSRNQLVKRSGRPVRGRLNIIERILQSQDFYCVSSVTNLGFAVLLRHFSSRTIREPLGALISSQKVS